MSVTIHLFTDRTKLLGKNKANQKIVAIYKIKIKSLSQKLKSTIMYVQLAEVQGLNRI